MTDINWSNIISPLVLVETLDDFENVKRPTRLQYIIECDRMKLSGSSVSNNRQKFNRNRDISKGIIENYQTLKFVRQYPLKCYE